MKRSFLLFCAIWLLLGLALIQDATTAEAGTMYIHVTSGSYLNGRHAPAKDSAVEMRLYRGDAVDVIGIDGEWVQIEGGEAGTCWCRVDYLADYPPGDEAPLYTVLSDGRVRVRQSPDGNTLRYLYDGDLVAVRFAMDGWAYLDDGGYVMTDYLAIQSTKE